MSMSDYIPGSNPQAAIVLDDCDDDVQDERDQQVNNILHARRDHRRRSSAVVKTEIDLSNDDYDNVIILAEQDLVKEIQFVDLVDDGGPPRSTKNERSEEKKMFPLHLSASPVSAAALLPLRSVPPPPRGNFFIHGSEGEVAVFYLANGQAVKRGSVVELRERDGRFRVQFLQVKTIIRNFTTNRCRIRGWPYTRARFLDGKLLRKLNEVCLIGHADEEDSRPWLEQALVDVSEDKVRRVRPSGLRTTNAAFPEFRFEMDSYKDKGKAWVENNEVLVCRYHYYLVYRDVVKKKLEQAHDWVLVHVDQEMADGEFRVRDSKKMQTWRGSKVRGGSFLPAASRQPEPEVINLDDEDGEEEAVEAIQRQPGQRYTVGDVFCGAGGASRGIQQAGLKLAFGVDHWDPAISSWRSNFGDTDSYKMDVDDFVEQQAAQYRVDMLHMSPPCQVWSPAHTVPGQNDESNMAALFCCSELLLKTRPRLFTLEQTFGMLHSRFELYFNGLVGGFTEHGYSVRWSVINLNTWGLCQPRRRLVMVGACPGERLPDFPAATHGIDRGRMLLPLTTARQALAHLREGDVLHNPDEMPQLPMFCPWDQDQPVPHTVTCSGGQNRHWSGRRDFTIREYATIQGFPVLHQFRGAYLKRQIGNAFPPNMARRLFRHLRAFLEREDGVVGETDEAVIDLDAITSPTDGGVIDLDGGDGIEPVGDAGSMPSASLPNSLGSLSSSVPRSLPSSVPRSLPSSVPSSVPNSQLPSSPPLISGGPIVYVSDDDDDDDSLPEMVLPEVMNIDEDDASDGSLTVWGGSPRPASQPWASPARPASSQQVSTSSQRVPTSSQQSFPSSQDVPPSSHYSGDTLFVDDEMNEEED